MESSSSSYFHRLISLLIVTHTVLLNFNPVISVHNFEDLYTRSRNSSVSYPPLPSPSSLPPPPPQLPQLPPLPPSPVPALFIIGDSSVDCGTNNFLGTLARADHLPYGRDFDTHQPTGRFSNGRVPVDYLGN